MALWRYDPPGMRTAGQSTRAVRGQPNGLGKPRRTLALAAAPYLKAIVIVAACAVSALWAVTVPILQSPDENLHLDYVFALVHNGGLLSVRDRPVSADIAWPAATDPQVQYIASRTGFGSIIFMPDVRAPQGYGTRDYFESLDRNAPGSHSGSLSPWLLPHSPFLPYAAYALVVDLTGHIFPGISTAIFSARLLSTFLLALSLIFTDRLCRLRDLGTFRSIFILLAVGLAPLTSFVTSYVQPDNLSLCLVTGGLLLLHRWSESRASTDAAAIGVCLGLLLVTKYQFFLCVGIAAAGLLAATPTAVRRAERLWQALLLVVPSLMTWAIGFWVIAGGSTPFIDSKPSIQHGSTAALIASANAGPWALVVHVVRALRAATKDYFLGGNTFGSYWGRFGWMDTPIVIVNPSTTKIVLDLLEVATVLIAGALLLLLLNTGRRAALAMWAGHFHETARIVFGDPVAVAYGAFVCFMLLLWVVIGDTFDGQGRNWFPVMPAAVIVTVSLAPRVIPWPRWQARLSNTLLAGLVTYSLIGSVYAFITVQHRYYGVGRAIQPVSVAGLPVMDGQGDFNVSRFNLPYEVTSPPAPPAVLPGGTIAIAGWAFDRQASAPARAVFITIDDGSMVQAFYGDPTSDFPSAYAPVYDRAGFDAIIGTEGLLPGPHFLGVLVVSGDGKRVYSSQKRFAFEVASP